MAFKKVSVNKKYFKYAECTKGQQLVVEGSYMGPYEGKFGVQHDFKQKDGEIVCLNSAGQLNYLLENHVEVGDLVNVYYDGSVMLTKGTFKGKNAHNFSIEVDTDGAKVKHDKAPEAVTTPFDASTDISL